MVQILIPARVGLWRSGLFENRGFGARAQPIGRRVPKPPDRTERQHASIPPDELSALFRFFNEIGIIEQLARNLFERVMPDGLKVSQFSVLNHFVRLGGKRSPLELARSFQVTKGAMTNTLQRLETRRLVKITPDPDDGRGKKVEITDAGRQMHEDCIKALVPALIAMGQSLDQERMKAATPLLTEVRKYLDENRIPPDPTDPSA